MSERASLGEGRPSPYKVEFFGVAFRGLFFISVLLLIDGVLRKDTWYCLMAWLGLFFSIGFRDEYRRLRGV